MGLVIDNAFFFSFFSFMGKLCLLLTSVSISILSVYHPMEAQRSDVKFLVDQDAKLTQ